MKLWVDDERPVPDESWTLATNADDAYALLQENVFTVVSLDFVLMRGGDQGDEIVRWMSDHALWPTDLLTFHSSSYSGRELQRMIAQASDSRPEGMEIG